ncbi:helix-turn-helix domain-containing protein [Nitratireductor pacificus]|uniref:helix-turn-helix domain-containing protein n=1 Tax=Nitratireductor pacificus TaxID=1231180 RepID=UPI003B75C7FD
MSEGEAAKALGVSNDTLQRMRKRGDIGYLKVGGRYRYTEQILLEYIESRTVKACAKSESGSEKLPGTGSLSARVRRDGTRPGSTPLPDKQSAFRSAQRTFGKPRSS